MDSPDPQPPGRAAFAFVFVTVVLDMIALGVMVPVLPKLVTQLEGGSISSAAKIIGVFGFAWAAMQLFFSPMLGALSDRYGRRPVILLSNFGLGLDYLLMALAPSLWWLFVGRLISGLTAASFPTASAYISDVTPPEKRAGQFGMLGAAFGLGFVIGPAVGGVLGGINLRLPFWVAAGLSLANAAYGFFILPESLPKERRVNVSWRLANPLGALKLLRSHPELLGLAAVSTFFYLAHEALPSVFVLYTDHRYGWGPQTIGLVLAVVGVCSTLVAALLIGPVVARQGERRALLGGLLCGVAGFLTGGLAPTGAIYLISIPLNAFLGLCSPAMQALMTRRVDVTEQGQLQGALGSLRGLTGMVGPLLFTQIFAVAINPPRGMAEVPGAPFLLSAVLLAASMLVSWRVLARPAPGDSAPMERTASVPPG